MEKNVSIVKVDKRHYRVIAQENWGLTKGQMKGMHVHHRIPRSKGGTNDASNLFVCSPSFHRWVWHNGEEFIEWATKGGREGGNRVHEEKDEEGRSIHAVKAAEKMNAEKDEMGRSVSGVKAAAKLHSKKDDQGRSVNAVRFGSEGAKVVHLEKDEKGRSKHAVKAATTTHKQKDDLGRSLHMMKIHEEKDDLGRSVVAMKSHKEKDELGRSVLAVKTVTALNAQKWVDPQHPELGAHSSGTLSSMQKRRGLAYGPGNRVKVVSER